MRKNSKSSVNGVGQKCSVRACSSALYSKIKEKMGKAKREKRKAGKIENRRVRVREEEILEKVVPKKASGLRIKRFSGAGKGLVSPLKKTTSSFLNYNNVMWSTSGKELNPPRPCLIENRIVRQTDGQKRTSLRPVLPGENRSNKTNRVSSYEDWYKAVFGMEMTANLVGR